MSIYHDVQVSLRNSLRLIKGLFPSNSTKGAEMSYMEQEMALKKLQDKAKKIFLENGWDLLLVDAYLSIEHFVAWSKREDFEKRYNIGVKNIRSVRKSIDIGRVSNETEFLVGDINGINFTFGGVTSSSCFSENDCPTIITSLSLFIDDKRVIAARYARSDEAFSAEDYSLDSVEEFHNDPRIPSLLKAFHDGKTELERKNKKIDEELKKKELDLKYSGKFTF